VPKSRAPVGDNDLMPIQARVRLLPTEDGGLQGPMPTPCQSLLLRVTDSSTDIGVRIATDSGASLMPGSTEDVTLTFWAEDVVAEDVVVERIQSGVKFVLRYPVRVVAEGEVTRVS
jgi:hypothetical protein